jgi:hypothetical protein
VPHRQRQLRPAHLRGGGGKHAAPVPVQMRAHGGRCQLTPCGPHLHALLTQHPRVPCPPVALPRAGRTCGPFRCALPPFPGLRWPLGNPPDCFSAASPRAARRGRAPLTRPPACVLHSCAGARAPAAQVPRTVALRALAARVAKRAMRFAAVLLAAAACGLLGGVRAYTDPAERAWRARSLAVWHQRISASSSAVLQFCSSEDAVLARDPTQCNACWRCALRCRRAASAAPSPAGRAPPTGRATRAARAAAPTTRGATTAAAGSTSRAGALPGRHGTCACRQLRACGHRLPPLHVSHHVQRGRDACPMTVCAGRMI